MAGKGIIPGFGGAQCLGTPEKRWQEVHAEKVYAQAVMSPELEELRNRLWQAGQQVEVGEVRWPSVSKGKAQLFLQCQAGGKTGEEQPQWPEAGQQQVDGEVTWLVRDFKEGGSGLPVGFIFPWLSRQAPKGCLALDGCLLERAMYPQLWEFAEASGNLVAEEVWQALAAEQDSVGQFSEGDGESTFRLPKLLDFVRATDGEVRGVGEWQGDATRPLTGEINFFGMSTSATQDKGSLKLRPNRSGYTWNEGKYYATNLLLDSSAEVPTAEENRPKSVSYVWYVKAFEGGGQAGELDLTALAAKVNQLVDGVGFSYVYPNGGSEESPAEVTVNKRYVLANPYPGYEVGCEAEVFLNGKWSGLNWVVVDGTNENSSGMKAWYVQPDDYVVLVTGVRSLTGAYYYHGNAFAYDGAEIRSLPCRIKVWKIGGTASRQVDRFIERDSCWLYPNGGTQQQPGTVAVKNRYVLANPFPGYVVKCRAEVFYGGEWGETGIYNNIYNDGSQSAFVLAAQNCTTDEVVVATGRNWLMCERHLSGNPLSTTTNNVPGPLPCRVYVEKGGRLPG